MSSFIRLTSIGLLGITLLLLQKHQIEVYVENTLGTHDIPLARDLTCLEHKPSVLGESLKPGSDPTRNILEHERAITCGRLRRNWLWNQPLSDYAKKIEAHQSNCSIALGKHHFDNTFGLGSHLILWGQAVCNGIESSLRIRSHASEWLWLDQEHCDMEKEAVLSPLLCYFPSSESQCIHIQQEGQESTEQSIPNITDPRDQNGWCSDVKESDQSKAIVRASATEYLFQKVSPLVISEAKRQIGIIFPKGEVPEDVITVHIRWGDKFWEMDLPPIQEYIDAVYSILLKNATRHNDERVRTMSVNTTSAKIYLATEDPKAYQAFMDAKPHGWSVYADITLFEINDFRPTKGNRASWAARNTKGRSGLIAMASLLVAMEANMFVLTTKSNWSTIMNHLRTNIIDPRCNNCTMMVDLRPGSY